MLPMHWYRNNFDGKERLWVEDDEFETITEAELRAATLYPTAAQPVVDIERFIQRHMKVALDQHADLGDGIAGAIKFDPVRTRIFISRRLTELADEVDCPPGVRGRWRATMAHEATHGLLHCRVFEINPSQGILFDVPEEDQGPPQIIKCSDSDISFESAPTTGVSIRPTEGWRLSSCPGRYSSNWREMRCPVSRTRGSQFCRNRESSTRS